MCGTAADDPTQHDVGSDRVGCRCNAMRNQEHEMGSAGCAYAEPVTDVFGRPLVTADDGHSAWSCNDWLCQIHPDSIYGRGDRQVRRSMTDRDPLGTWSAAKADAAQAVEAAAVEARVNPQPADSPSITHVRNALSELLQVSDQALHQVTDPLRVRLAQIIRKVDEGEL